MNELVIINKPYSAVSEEIKRIRTNIKFSSVDEDTKVIAVTSSVPGEGKSFISANLAVSFALNGDKVLIIDCDLRKGRQNKIFGIPYKSIEGFSNLLIDQKEHYVSYLMKTKIENLHLIPVGPYPPNPSELLASKKCQSIIEELKKHFDVIILDCPPISGLNDTLVVSTYADLSIIVAKHKKTSMDILAKSKKALETVGAKKISVVLNQMDVRSSTYYSGYYATKKEKE